MSYVYGLLGTGDESGCMIEEVDVDAGTITKRILFDKLQKRFDEEMKKAVENAPVGTPFKTKEEIQKEFLGILIDAIGDYPEDLQIPLFKSIRKNTKGIVAYPLMLLMGSEEREIVRKMTTKNQLTELLNQSQNFSSLDFLLEQQEGIDWAKLRLQDSSLEEIAKLHYSNAESMQNFLNLITPDQKEFVAVKVMHYVTKRLEFLADFSHIALHQRGVHQIEELCQMFEKYKPFMAEKQVVVIQETFYTSINKGYRLKRRLNRILQENWDRYLRDRYRRIWRNVETILAGYQNEEWESMRAMFVMTKLKRDEGGEQ